MINKLSLKQLKQCALNLRKAEYSGKSTNVVRQMKNNYHNVINILFSNVPGAVSLQSPKCCIQIMQGTTPIIGMDHNTLSTNEKTNINMCQSYLDDLDRINSLNDNLATKSHLLINEYIYMFFDLQNKTHHYVYYFSSNKQSINPDSYHPKMTFNKRCNRTHKYILLHTNISMVRLIKGDSDSKMEEIFSYIPKSIYAMWSNIGV